MLRKFTLAILLTTVPTCLVAEPILQIVSPANGAVIHTGETFVVSVGTTGGQFGGVILFSPPFENPFNTMNTAQTIKTLTRRRS
jgi:hypothetical protein